MIFHSSQVPIKTVKQIHFISVWIVYFAEVMTSYQRAQGTSHLILDMRQSIIKSLQMLNMYAVDNMNIINLNKQRLPYTICRKRWFCFNDPAWESSGWVGNIPTTYIQLSGAGSKIKVIKEVW